MGTARCPEELINPGRQANIHWRCNLGEKEAELPVAHPIGEPGAQAQGRQDQDSAKTANHAIKFSSALVIYR